MKTFLKKLAVYAFDELVADWIFILKECPVIMPLLFIGFILNLPIGIKETVKSIRKDIWGIRDRKLCWRFFRMP